jgi:predicted transposase YdaD
VTRIEDLVVKEVRTQYRISKINSHDAVLDVLAEDGIHVTYVNAEIEDGTEVSQLMKYFKTTDPEDMSQGELSKRIHFLKCEEGGLKVMCEMSEKWIEEGREEGRAEGEERKAKEVVFSLADRGLSAENIADIVKMNIAVVKQWLEGATAAR